MGNLLEMEPLDALGLLEKEVCFTPLTELNNEADYQKAASQLNKAAAFICFFRQLETAAKIRKRKARREKKGTEEVERLMGLEEVFETYKKISEQSYDVITRVFTSKRLFLDEYKTMGKTT